LRKVPITAPIFFSARAGARLSTALYFRARAGARLSALLQNLEQTDTASGNVPILFLCLLVLFIGADSVTPGGGAVPDEDGFGVWGLEMAVRPAHRSTWYAFYCHDGGEIL
jgi:hypothetical protein